MTGWVKVARASDLKPEEKMVITVSDENILVLNHGGRFYAMSSVCTHEKVELVDGFLLEDSIVCPAHLSEFSLETGAVLNPPATVPLKTYDVKIEGEEIWVAV